MTAADARAEMESDLAWRQDEIRFLQNQGASLDKAEQRDQFRRSLVLLLYAHFEGYCKFALSVYVGAVNLVGMCCDQANEAIAASTLADAFAALRHPNSKCDVFRRSAPDDAALHLFAREREFACRIASFQSRTVKLPDSVVDTESNLRPVVLRKNLYRLGLDVAAMEAVEGDINQLLQMRNKIAHGETRKGVDEKAYEALRSAAFRVMHEITAQVTEAIQKQLYRRPADA